MGKKSSGKGGSFWRTDWFLGVLVVLVVVLLHVSTDVIGTLERRFYDYASTSSGRQPSDRIAVIAIDNTSIANIGRWPWPRDVHAELIDKLAQAKAKTVVHTAFFFEPQTDRGLVYIQRMKETLGQPSDGVGEQLARVIAEAEAALDSDGKLAASMQRAGNVIIPSVYQLGVPQGRPDAPLPPFAEKSSIAENQEFSVPAVRMQQPIERIGTAAVGIGHLNQSQDADGAVRREPLIVSYGGRGVPSMSLLAAMHSLNLTLSDLRLQAPEAVQIGRLRISTDAQAQMLPQFYRGRDGRPAFQVDSFFDVMTGKVPATKYVDKVVIIGATADGVGTLFPTPVNPALSPAETIAHITSSILGEHFIVQPGWATWVALLVFVLVAGYLIALLPRLSAGMAAGVTALLFVLLIGAEYGLLSGSGLWLQLAFPAALLLIGHLALTTKRFLVTEAGKLKSDEESAETNRMMGLAMAGQGRLDEAFDRYRRVPFSDALMDNLYNLALDYERKRQFNKAQAVYEHMAQHDKGYKDLQAKLTRAKNLSETVILGGGGSHPGGTMLLDGGAVEKPMLGRYQVEKELGKGAMGVVYQGRDPKIGRVVAIKTMALSQEFEGEELQDARERFFREAETAGRLQHQNIVTIFDAGEEHDLAYIAMEFLRGKDLVDFCRDGHLLPVPKVASIIARVAEALAYAHAQNVVHRDIKPANIMYEPQSDVVKVTDFGIARITDSSKTKTGLVLGTPSFMSPEQIAGKKVDGRSDLYSLGVTLFQMLTGVLPFRGDSMAELMYKIANEEAPDIRIVRSDIPPALAAVVARSLAKKPEARYQSGVDFANELRAAVGGTAAGASAGTSTGAMRAQPAAARPGPAADEKTVIMGAASAAVPAAAAADKTVIMAPSAAAPAAPTAGSAEGIAPPVQAPINFEATVPHLRPRPPAPGYDAPAGLGLGADDPFAKTVVTRPGGGTPTGGEGS